MKLITTTTIALIGTATQSQANKWGTKKCKNVRKAGEVSGDCANELISCTNAKTVTDAEYQNCVNIKLMDAFWSPPKLSVCIEKFAAGADRDTCNTTLRGHITNCHGQGAYYTSQKCIDLSAYIDTLEAMPDLNTPTDDELENPFWRITTPCQAFQYASISLGANNFATAGEENIYNNCLAAYISAVPLEISCQGGDTTACDSWWDLQAALPDGQKRGNPYAAPLKVKTEVVYCDGLVDDGVENLLTACNDKVATLAQLKINCNKENDGDIIHAGACELYKTTRGEVMGEKPVKQLTYDMCTADHWNFGADTAACQAAVDALNAARTACAADTTSTECMKVRDLKNSIQPQKTSSDLCENAADKAACEAEVVVIEGMQADCKAEIDGDATKAGSCDALKQKRKEVGGKGNPLHEKFKAPKRDLCAGAADAAACQVNVDLLGDMKKLCRAERKGDTTKAGSCDAYEAKKTELFPDDFPQKKAPRDLCDGAADPTACAAAVEVVKQLQIDCQQENAGDITKGGSCDNLITKRKELMPKKVAVTKPIDSSECDDAADNAACLVVLDEIQALRPDCIAENKGDLTKVGSCKSLNSKRRELRPKEGFVDRCTGVADEAACRAKQAEIDNLKDDCDAENNNDLTKVGSCASLKAKKKEIKALSQADPCDSLAADEIQPCKDAAATIGQLRKDCRTAKAAGEENPQACTDFMAANEKIPSVSRTKKPRNLCDRLPADQQVACEAAYVLVEDLWPKCAIHKKEGNADHQECLDLATNVALLPARKTKEEKAAEAADKAANAIVHPCETLATPEEVSACKVSYENIKTLKAACIADNKADVANSQNCIDLKAALAEPGLPQADKSKKNSKIAAQGGIILGKSLNKRSVDEADYIGSKTGKSLSYRR